MPLKTFVKASAITNLSDARYFSAFPVNWMSFQCNPISQKFVPHNTIIELIGWLEGPDFCLEVAGLDSDHIKKLLQEIKVQGIEYEAGQPTMQAVADNYIVFRRLYLDKHTTKESLNNMLSFADNTDIFILDFQLNQLTFSQLANNQLFISVDEISELSEDYELLLAIDCNETEVKQILNWQLKGLDFRGGEEEKVGIRSFDDIQDIMDVLDEWE